MYTGKGLVIQILFIFSLNSVEPTAKLNVPRVLLPVFKDLSVNFTLDVTGSGCYKWSTNRPDLISVDAIYKTKSSTCSQHAVVTVLTKELTRKTARIFVEDSNLDLDLRADVIIDVIASLKIVTKSLQLYMEDPPQMFEVRAYDHQGNEFTTLEGVEFQWTVHAVVSDTTGPVMRLMTFSESPYETPLSIAAFDNLGKHGHIVLLEGIRTGSAKVAVQLPHPEYNFVPHAEVQLLVVANLILEPSTAYMLLGDEIVFTLYQIRHGKKYVIDAYDDQYTLVSQNNYVAEVNQRKVIGHTIGKVEIMVHDTHITDSDLIKLPSALLVVAEPHYMILNILPYNTWSLTVQQKATIIPEIYSENNHKFVIGERTTISTTVPEDIFEVHALRQNGSVSGLCSRVGSGKVTAELVDSLHKYPNKISTENTLHIYPKVVISPEILILPWSSDYTPNLTGFILEASGGDGNYVWSSADTSIVQATQNGSLKFKGPGSTNVTVSMRKNKNSKASAVIHLLVPEEISVVNDVHEAEVGDNIHLNIILYGRIENSKSKEKIAFSICDFLDFIVTPQFPFSNTECPDVKPKGMACAVKSIKSSAVGLSRVMVSLESASHDLFTRTMVFAYRPLISIQPKLKEDVILALGSTYDLVFSGGPHAIFGPIKSQGSHSQVVFKSKNYVSRPELYVFKVRCLKIGTSFFELAVRSFPLGFQGVKVLSKVRIDCKVPKSLEIVGNFRTGCSEIFPQRMVSYPSSTVRFDVKIIDERGNMFKNASSIQFKWTFDNKTIATFNQFDKVLLQQKVHPEFRTPVTHYITATTYQESGEVIGRGSMVGYRKEYSYIYSSEDMFRFSQESARVSFMLSVVKEPVVEPTFLSLFYHPNNVGHLKIKGGSGHFNLDFSLPIASIKYNSKTRTADIFPTSEGNGEIVITDKCLPDLFPLRIEVQIVSVASVTISSPLKIQEGQSEKVTVRVFDKDDKPLAFPVMSYTKLGLKMEISDSSVAEFDRSSKAHLDYSKGIIDIQLKGKKIGQASIWAQWLDVKSNVLTIQVFPRIKISPRNLTLVVGSEMQIKVTGGPSLDSYIHFMISDPTITSVTNDAIIKGLKLGRTIVTAMSMGFQGEVFCKDAIEVHVIALAGVHISAPITELGVGNTMPMWASGFPHTITPLLLGSISPPLQFKWQVTSPNVAQIRDTLYNTKIQVSTENKLSVRLYGLSAGFTTVELLVFGRGLDKNYISYNSSIQIVVLDTLQWARPQMGYSYMLMPCNTSFALKTNLPEHEGHIFRATDWNLDPGNPLVTVSPEGIVQTGSNFGTAVVLAKTHGKSSSSKTLGLFIQIEPVHYLMINIDTALETSEEVKSLPRGLYLNMTVSYHNQYGNAFFVAPLSKPVYQCNICSKIYIEYSGSNHNLFTSLANAGNVVLRVHDTIKQVEMEDFIRIPVDNYIIPNKPFLTVGEIVCYWTPLLSQNGIWSADSHILNVNKNGVAFAERSGFATIMYSVSHPEPVILASISLEILPLQSFLIGPFSSKSITNKVGLKYYVPVTLINEKTKKEPSYSKNCNRSNVEFHAFPFFCELHYTTLTELYPIEEIFKAWPDFDFETGSYVCVISPIKGAGEPTSHIESNLTLTVTNRKSNYDTFFLIFHPQFTVNVDRLYLTREYKLTHATVSGSYNVLRNIYIETSGHKFISVGPINYDEKGELRFSVKLDIFDWEFVSPEEDVHIFVSSSYTSQREKIRVVIDLKAHSVHSVAMLGSRIYDTICLFGSAIISGLLLQNLLISLLTYGPILFGAYVWTCSRPLHNEFLGKKSELLGRGGLMSSQSDIWSQRSSNYTSSNAPLMASPNFLKSTRRSDSSAFASQSSSPGSMTYFNLQQSNASPSESPELRSRRWISSSSSPESSSSFS